jgi:hypothetical protein
MLIATSAGKEPLHDLDLLIVVESPNHGDPLEQALLRVLLDEHELVSEVAEQGTPRDRECCVAARNDHRELGGHSR